MYYHLSGSPRLAYFQERDHLVRSPGGRTVGRYKAKCKVTVRESNADLDYEAFPGFNRKNDNVLGVMRIRFADNHRRQPIQVLWKAKGGNAFRPFSTTLGLEDPQTFNASVDVDLMQTSANEGRQYLATHLKRERSAKLVAAKKAAVLAQGSQLACEACGFKFEDAYGELGKDYCEVHHREPLADSDNSKNTLRDLAILCSNCHRMIHKTRPLMSVGKFAKTCLTARR